LVAFLAARASAVEGVTRHVNLETDQLISQRGESVEIIISESILKSYILALNIAQCTKLSPNGLGPTAWTATWPGSGAGSEPPNFRYLPLLLCLSTF
jgi:hypothetical protein